MYFISIKFSFVQKTLKIKNIKEIGCFNLSAKTNYNEKKMVDIFVSNNSPSIVLLFGKYLLNNNDDNLKMETQKINFMKNEIMRRYHKDRQIRRLR